MSPRLRGRLVSLLRVALGLAGLALLAWIVHRLGLRALAAVLGPALLWLPLAVGLDVARIACDGAASRAVLGATGRALPSRLFFGAQWVAFAVMCVAPAGRATAEAVKGSLLAPHVGAGRAAAMAAADQAVVFLASGAFSIVNAVAAALVTGPSLLTGLLFAHAGAMIALGVGTRVATLHEPFARWLRRRIPALAAHLESFTESSREAGWIPWRATALMVLGRALQSLQYLVLAVAVGANVGLLGALTLHGIHFVVAFLAVLVPGLVGATEGAFLLAAGPLGISEAQAAGVALLGRAVQLLLAGSGFLLLLLWRSRRRSERGEPGDGPLDGPHPRGAPEEVGEDDARPG